MVVELPERMPRLIHTANALREVRRAQLDFLLNWTRDLSRPNGQGRMRDLELSDESDKRDWRHLYDGSVLDD